VYPLVSHDSSRNLHARDDSARVVWRYHRPYTDATSPNATRRDATRRPREDVPTDARIRGRRRGRDERVETNERERDDDSDGRTDGGASARTIDRFDSIRFDLI